MPMNTNTESSTSTLLPNNNDKFESLVMVRTGRWPRLFGIALAITSILTSILALFIPWRQSVVGSGEIIVFSPMERPQTIEAQIPGRLLQWYVRDGQLVTAGQLIAELSDIDPRFLSHNQLKTLVDQRDALISKREAAKQRLSSLTDQSKDI